MNRVIAVALVLLCCAACKGESTTAHPTTTEASTSTSTSTTTSTMATTTTVLTKGAWLSLYKGGLFRLPDLLGAIAIDTHNPATDETTCNLLVREVILAEAVPAPPDARMAGVWAELLTLAKPTADVCSQRPRALTAADRRAADDASSAYVGRLSEFTAAATAP